MALVPTCDKCATPGQITQILGKDVCNKCVSELREWLEAPSIRTSTILDMALDVIARKGSASAESVARHALGRTPTKEERRRYSYSLHACKKRGQLVNVRHGLYTAPVKP